jgi:hypothetical protein
MSDVNPETQLNSSGVSNLVYVDTLYKYTPYYVVQPDREQSWKVQILSV